MIVTIAATPSASAIPNSTPAILGYQAGAAGGTSGNAAGTASFACFGQPTMLVTGGVKGGCAGAAAFATNADFSGPVWGFAASASVAACGGGLIIDIGYAPHATCAGWSSADADRSPGGAFGCATIGGTVETYWSGACTGASGSVGSSECAEADAAGHASAAIATWQADAAAHGTSGGCASDTKAVRTLLTNTKGAVSQQSQTIMPSAEVPEDVLTHLEASLRGDLTELVNQIDQQVAQDVEHPIAVDLWEQLRPSLLDEIEALTIEEVLAEQSQ